MALSIRSVVLGLFTIFFSQYASAEYSLNLSAVHYQTHLFEDFRTQRTLLFTLGFPGVDTSIQQAVDSSSDSFQITVGYRANRYYSFKLSYLGESKYSLKSNYTYAIPSSGNDLNRQISVADNFEVTIHGITFGAYAELPLREEISLGLTAGAMLSRTKSSQLIEREMETTDELSNVSAESEIFRESHSEYDMNLMSGLYSSIKVSPSFKIILQWNRYFDLGNKSTSPSLIDLSGDPVRIEAKDGDFVDSYSIGLQYRFSHPKLD